MVDDIKRLHAIVHGRVQGVSFRYYTTLKARELDITGWVLNRRDGTVEVVAEGHTDTLETLKQWLQEGSPAANVTQLEAALGTATGEFTTFETVYFKQG